MIARATVGFGGEWQEVFIHSPAVVGGQPGTMFPGARGGRCVFYRDGQCAIHAVKPWECAEYAHGDSEEVITRRVAHLVRAWKRRAAARLTKGLSDGWTILR